jgi:hypothetical protein
MTDLIRTLCERLARGLDRDPQRLAAQLGIAHSPAAPGLPIKVTPSNPSFTAADVFADGDTTSMVNLVPTHELTIGTLENILGPWEQSPRLHPHDSRKLVFSPDQDSAHPFEVRVVAYVSADKVIDAAAQVQKLTIICSPAFAKDETPPPVIESPPIAIWSTLLGEPARFEVRAWRTYSLTTLEDIRSELEKALGVHFQPGPGERKHTYECALPACDLRLSSSPSENSQLQIFQLVGVPSEDHESEDISEALAAHLRAADCDWYVPDALEKQGDVLGDRLLDRDVLVSLLAPRWLAWAEGDDRDTALELLEGIADLWLSAARATSDPVADVRRRKAEFQGWGRYFPRSRTKSLFSYAVQAQLGVIEDELFELSLLSAAERAALPNLATRLAEWREAVLSIDEAVKATRVPETRSQYNEVLASIDEMVAEIGGRLKATPDRTIWSRLLGGPARFALRSLRRATLDDVRAELENALGVEFFPFDEVMYDGPPGFRCVTRACDLGLFSEPTEQPERLAFNFIGVPASSDAQTISGELAQYLRAANSEWDVSDEPES